MKRVGHLMERIANHDNLREAFLRASRGKQHRQVVQQFRARLDSNLSLMRQQLLDGTFRFGDYQFFTVYDPKRREICAAAFPERVAQHAMMRICHPVLDGYQSPDSFASRKGRGTYAALEKAVQLSRRYYYFAKLDVVRYFDSIDHRVLKDQLSGLFKDPLLLEYFGRLVDGYHGPSIGKGVPIGNLSSQYFANHYLSPADHYLRREMRAPGVIRYMDDVLIFAENKLQLRRLVNEYESFGSSTLLLEHHPIVMNHVRFGIPFLGYVVRPGGLKLNLRSKRRYSTKMGHLSAMLNDGTITQEIFSQRAGCLLAFIDKAESMGFRKVDMLRHGMLPQGL